MRHIWIEDLAAAEQGFPRAKIAAEAGLKAAIGMPIVSEGKVLAIFVFFLRDVRDNDKRFANILVVISAQIGGLFQRKLNDEARRKLQQRYESLVNNINVGVYRVDEQRNLFILAMMRRCLLYDYQINIYRPVNGRRTFSCYHSERVSL